MRESNVSRIATELRKAFKLEGISSSTFDILERFIDEKIAVAIDDIDDKINKRGEHDPDY